MKEYTRYFRLVGVLVAATVILAGLWLHDRYGEKSIPAFGGSNLSVKLPDKAQFQQADPRWSSARMGRPDANTLANAGCTVASVAMALTNLGYPFTPGELNAALTAEGGFTQRSWLVWDSVSRVTKGGVRIDIHREPSQDKLDACLARGDYPVVRFRIAQVIPHWVLVVGKHDGTYFIRDPGINEPEPVPLTRRTSVIYSVRCIGKAPGAAKTADVPKTPDAAKTPDAPKAPAASAPTDAPKAPDGGKSI